MRVSLGDAFLPPLRGVRRGSSAASIFIVALMFGLALSPGNTHSRIELRTEGEAHHTIQAPESARSGLTARGACRGFPTAVQSLEAKSAEVARALAKGQLRGARRGVEAVLEETEAALTALATEPGGEAADACHWEEGYDRALANLRRFYDALAFPQAVELLDKAKLTRFKAESISSALEAIKALRAASAAPTGKAPLGQFLAAKLLEPLPGFGEAEGGVSCSRAVGGVLRALIVGISDYDSELVNDPPGAASDLALMERSMRDRGANVVALSNATRDRILDAMRAVAGQAGCNDQVLFHFSGYAWTWREFPPPGGTRRWFLPRYAGPRTASSRTSRLSGASSCRNSSPRSATRAPPSSWCWTPPTPPDCRFRDSRSSPGARANGRRSPIVRGGYARPKAPCRTSATRSRRSPTTPATTPSFTPPQRTMRPLKSSGRARPAARVPTASSLSPSAGRCRPRSSRGAGRGEGG